jgi:hypothetical protein
MLVLHQSERLLSDCLHVLAERSKPNSRLFACAGRKKQAKQQAFVSLIPSLGELLFIVIPCGLGIMLAEVG